MDIPAILRQVGSLLCGDDGGDETLLRDQLDD